MYIIFCIFSNSHPFLSWEVSGYATVGINSLIVWKYDRNVTLPE